MEIDAFINQLFSLYIGFYKGIAVVLKIDYIGRRNVKKP